MAIRIGFKKKLIFSYVIVALVSFVAIVFFLNRELEKNSLRDIRTSLLSQAGLVEAQIGTASVKSEDITSLEELVKSLSNITKSRITIINKNGKVLADSRKPVKDIESMQNHLKRPEVRAALDGGIGSETRYSPTLKINMLYVAVPIKRSGEIIGIVRLALSLEGVQKTLFGIRKIVISGMAFALAFALLLGYILAERTIRPINRMIDVSRRFAEGDFSRRIVCTSQDEIGQLASTLNKMAQDIETKIGEVGEHNQQLGAIFSSMIEGIIVVDKSGRIASINPTIEKIFDIKRKDVEGKHFLEAVRNHEISGIIEEVLHAGSGVSSEISLVLPVQKIFQVNAVPIFDNKNISGCLVVIHDITEIRRLETVRSDFIANVSHELKTPLTSIKGFVETLLDGALDEKENSHEFLKIVYDHAERLNNLVNDLLSLSYLESKDIILKKSVFNLRQQVEEVILGFGSQLKKKNIKISDEIPHNISISADKNRIVQVLTNFIDNAIKFNREKGTIRILNEDAGAKMKILIEDSGVGIPEKDIPRIFERFYRVDKARSRELGGTGLGLSIVKHIVELHGGEVGVQSSEGLGSKFWFTLPNK